MGFSVSKQPSYMYQSPSGYIFRLRIPYDLRELVGKCKFRYSLRAGALRVARHRAKCIASYTQQLFIKVRKNMTEFTPEHITQLVKEHVRDILGDDQACSKMSATAAPGSIIVNGETALEASSTAKAATKYR